MGEGAEITDCCEGEVVEICLESLRRPASFVESESGRRRMVREKGGEQTSSLRTEEDKGKLVKSCAGERQGEISKQREVDSNRFFYLSPDSLDSFVSSWRVFGCIRAL